MSVDKNSSQLSNGSGSLQVQGTRTEPTFGNQATGLSSGFQRQNNTIFGTFPNQNNQQQNTNNNSAAFGSQSGVFGNNFFHNQGFFQPQNFGFGRTMGQQTTNIFFTGFGEVKTNYCFSSPSSASVKKVTLMFEHTDVIFGSSILRKPITVVEIEVHPISDLVSNTNYNDFSFSVGMLEKHNSMFIVKSARPMNFLIRVKQPGPNIDNTTPSSFNYENRKITLTFQSDQPQYIPNTNILRPVGTIVEILLPHTKTTPFCSISNQDFKFSVGPTGTSNSFKVQTSKNAVFKIEFAETGKYINSQLFGNRQTRTGSVFFDQGRQINAFPTTSATLFGQASSGFGANQSFGSSTTGNNDMSSNRAQPINGSLFGNPTPNNRIGETSLFGADQSFGSSTSGAAAAVPESKSHSLFGANQSFGNSTSGKATAVPESFDKSHQMNIVPTAEGSLFGANQSFGNSKSGAAAAVPESKSRSLFGANQSFGNSTSGKATAVPESFDKSHQMNIVPTAGGSLFGANQSFGNSKSGAAAAVPESKSRSLFGANQSFGNSTSGKATAVPESFDKSHQMNIVPTAGGSLFGANQSFGNPTSSATAAVPESFDKNRQMNDISTEGGSLFSSGNGGASLMGQLCGSSKTETGSLINKPTSSLHNKDFALDENQSFTNSTSLTHEVPSVGGISVNYQPTFCTEFLANQGCVQTKTNCITAMNEYANVSLEELRLQDYLRNNLTTNYIRTEKTVISNAFRAYNSSHNMFGNTNQAFFDQLHQLIPYLNAGSICKCVRSSNTRTNSDSLDRLYVNTQKSRLNDNITIDEFYQDVFKYLEYIQKQYRHLENTLNNKNGKNITENHSIKFEAHKTDLESESESEKTSKQNTQKSPMPVFGGSTCSVANTSLSKNNSPINPGSENDTQTVEKVPSSFSTVEHKKSLLFGASTSKPLLSAFTTARNSDEEAKIKEVSQTEDKSDNSEKLKTEEGNRISSQETQKSPLTVFGCSTHSAENTSLNKNCSASENDTPSGKKVPNTFGSSSIPAAGKNAGSCSTIENANSTINLEPTKSLVCTDTKSKTDISALKPINFAFAITSGKPDNTVKVKEAKRILDDKSNFSRTNSMERKLINARKKMYITGTKYTIESKIHDKDTSSSSAMGEKPNIFSIKDTSSGSTVGEKITTLFSLTLPSQMAEKTPTHPIFPTKDTSSSSTADEKSIGLFSISVANSKPDNIDKIESGTNAVSISSSNESSSENLQKQTDNTAACSALNIVKEDDSSLKSCTSNENKNQCESSRLMDGQDVQTSQGCKMKTISDILASMEVDKSEKKGKRKDSLTKSDSGSDISSYSFISNQSSKNDGKENASSIQTEEHPTGIIMTRYGYYTFPSMQDLNSHINDDGDCVVSNFTIGRKGYGSICFNKEINVTGLNVDELVHFRNKEIIIYPERDSKSTVLTDLQKCDVLVTLEQVWPHDETNHKPIKDPQRLDKIKYEDKLRLICQKYDIKFVDYRPETGSWLFKMKQFTKNTINCWDVEDEDIRENKSLT